MLSGLFQQHKQDNVLFNCCSSNELVNAFHQHLVDLWRNVTKTKSSRLLSLNYSVLSNRICNN